MISALPMYDLPWLRQANDAFWALIAERLRAGGVPGVPSALQRGGNLVATWTSPSLLLGQTCGYPLVTRLNEAVRLVATPHYSAAECDGPYHRSAILVRRDDSVRSLDDLRGKRAGVNGYDSNSGMNLFRAAIAPIANGPHFFGSVGVTGSHARSIAAILSGRIDVASIDAVTLALLGDRYPRHAKRLRVLEWTAASPALPLITSIKNSDAVVAALQTALHDVVHHSNAGRSQRITGFSLLSKDDYRLVLRLEREAADYGYPELR